MTGIATAVASIISQQGESLQWKQVSSGAYNPTTGRTESDAVKTYSIKGHVRLYSAKEITGSLEYGDREVRFSPKSLDFTPRIGDEVRINNSWFVVHRIDHRKVGDESALYICNVRGVV